MKAVVYTEYGPPDVLQFKEVEKPVPGDEQVLVKVQAASINYPDWANLRGKPFLVRLMSGGLLKPKQTILGADIAGRVEAVGGNAKQFQPGDEVFGDISSSGFGGFAEYVAVPESALALKPANISFEEAAAVPMAGIVALQGLRDEDVALRPAEQGPTPKAAGQPQGPPGETPLKVKGRVWVIDNDNIDTDMIYHNRHLAVTDIDEMGTYCLGNLEGWQDFPERAKPGDVVVTGANFGCGSSRQHAVDCFKCVGVRAIIARSFGAIYERNAINAGLPIMEGDLGKLKLRDGDIISVDFTTGEVTKEATREKVAARPFSGVQIEIYKRGGLLNK